MLIRNNHRVQSLKNNPVHSCSIFLRVVLISLLCAGSFYAKTQTITIKKLPTVRQSINQKSYQWQTGGLDIIFKKEVLQSSVLLKRENTSNTFSQYIDEGIYKIPETELRDLWSFGKFGCPSCGSDKNKQHSEEFTNPVRFVSYQVTLGGGESSTSTNLYKTLCYMWEGSENTQRLLWKALFTDKEIRRSALDKGQSDWRGFPTNDSIRLMTKFGLSHLIE